MSARLPVQYFSRRFISDKKITHWPIHFAIIDLATSSAETGIETKQLQDYLEKNFSWVRPLSTLENQSKELQPCCAVNMSWLQACETGMKYGLEAVYFVSDNTLSVTYCDERRKPYVVDSFLNRFSVKTDQNES